MRLVMMGTGPFAVPLMRACYALAPRHEVVGLFVQPARGTPRKGKPLPESPTRVVAREHGTPVFDPEKLNRPEGQELLAALKPDLLVVADYGQILSAKTLALATYGGVNLHAALLPKYRGAAPINWAILHGEKETGVSVIHMTPQLDAGPVLAQARVDIGESETTAQLEPRLAELGAGLIAQTIDAIESGNTTPIIQDPALASLAPRLKKTDGAVDWSRSAEQIRNQIRAFDPWPGAYTFWLRTDGERLRLILGPAEVVRTENSLAHALPNDSTTPGYVLAASGDRLVIATGEGELRLTAVQPAGKRMLSAAEFLRGYPVEAGDLFGPMPELTEPLS
ncbi:MAG TPA: methionyl-tRNA formyltransferase [Pirellulales bacterium]